MNRILYCIKESLRSLIQGRMMTLISIITIAIALFVVIVPVVGIINIDHWFAQKENSTTLSIYFSDTLSDSSAQELYNELTGHFKHTCRYSSASDEYDLFSEKMGDELLGEIEDNPFGAALYVDSLSGLLTDSFISDLRAVSGVDDIVYRNEWVGKLQKYRANVNWILLIIVLVVSILVSFTIANTVKLTVYARRDLIKNMQYVGASDWYIKTPFLLEGVLQGLIGSLLSWGMIAIITSLVSSYLLWIDNFFLLIIMLLFGTLLGFIGSLRAVSKFFKLD